MVFMFTSFELMESFFVQLLAVCRMGTSIMLYANWQEQGWMQDVVLLFIAQVFGSLPLHTCMLARRLGGALC
jgi:hypothetical protein